MKQSLRTPTVGQTWVSASTSPQELSKETYRLVWIEGGVEDRQRSEVLKELGEHVIVQG
jgi:hypothetical protein